MSRKLKKGYFVRGEFVAEGSERDLELKAELKGTSDQSRTDLKRESTELQKLGEELLTLRADPVSYTHLDVYKRQTQKRVKPLVNGKGWDYTILLDINQEFKRTMGISNVPYLIVVKNGKIIFTENGHTPGGETELFEKLKNIK